MKKCIFCDSLLTKTSRSKEHVIPKWILDNLQSGYTYDHTGKWTTFPNKPELIINERKHSMFSSLLGGVCKRCNEGWMSDIETHFKPLFVALYDENSPIIFKKDQNLIFAQWAYKTAITWNYSANYKKIIPLNQIHSFYINKELPPNLKVDLAFCNEVGIHTLIGGNRIAVIPDSYKNKKELIDASYVATFQFDHLLIRISWTPDAKIQVRNISTNTVYRIYPMDKEELLIQYIKDDVYKDISHFHFFSTIFMEESIKENTLDFEKLVQSLQHLRSNYSF